MCPKSIVGKPGIWISHTCVDLICFPSSKFIIRGNVAGRLLSTSAPSIIKMEVAPMSVIAWLVAIVIALRYCGMGCPNNARAVNAYWYASQFLGTREMERCVLVGISIFGNAIDWRACCVACQWRKLFDVITVFSSSSMDDVPLMGVGFEAGSQAETKWLHFVVST